MLYVTTRNNQDAYTAHRTLAENRGPDGGLFIPFHSPVFSRENIENLAQKPFNACLAEILNLIFNTKLTSRELDLRIGRYCVRLKKLGRRTVLGESWHNPDGCFSAMVKELYGLLSSDGQASEIPGEWVTIGVRIAVLFGLFGEMRRQGIVDSENLIDISVASGDFSAPMSAWYARQWGLPLGNIICCCNENSNLWDLICHGQLRTDGIAIKTALSDADVCIPAGLERLIYAAGGPEETERYLDTLRRGSIYYAEDSLLQKLRQGIYVTVSGEARILSVIPGILGNTSCLVSPYTALAYTGLQDYRAGTGETRTCLVLSEKSPACDPDIVRTAIGISREQMQLLLNQM